MDSLLKADIFFFVTTVVVVVIAVFVVILLVYLVKIVRLVRDMSERVKREADAITNDVSQVREGLKKGDITAEDVGGYVKDFFTTRKGRKSKTKK